MSDERIAELEVEVQRLKDDNELLRATSVIDASAADVIKAIHDSIFDPGSHPQHHWDTYARHRREWPHLWRRIDALVGTPPGTRPA